MPEWVLYRREGKSTMQLKVLIGIIALIALVPISYGVAQCKPPSDIMLGCKTGDCVYNMDEQIEVTLYISQDNIGLENTQIKFYLHDVGAKDSCISNPSAYCIQRFTSGVYISNNKASVTFNSLGQYKEVEVTAVLVKDGSSATKRVSIRPAIQLTLSYPIIHATGQYIVNELAEVDNTIKNNVTGQNIINPDTLECKFYKDNSEIQPINSVCTPTKLSFTPLQTGSYKVYARATYTGKDNYGNDVLFYPSESSLNLDVQLPTQNVQLFLGAENVNTMDKTAEGAIQVDLKEYIFKITSSLNKQPYALDNCMIYMKAPTDTGSGTLLDFSESKCRDGVDEECVYTASYAFQQLADIYTMNGNCDHGEDIITFHKTFATLNIQPPKPSSYILPIIGGVIGLIVIIIIFAVIRRGGNQPTGRIQP